MNSDMPSEIQQFIDSADDKKTFEKTRHMRNFKNFAWTHFL